MRQARCENCGGFAPLNFDRFGNCTCRYCGREDPDRTVAGDRLGLAILIASGVAGLWLLWLGARLLTTLGA